VWGRSRCTPFTTPQLDEYGYYNLDATSYYEYAKRLKKVRRRGFSLQQTLIVDDTPAKVQQNYGNAIRHNAVYETTVRWLHNHLPVKNSCILTQGGIATLPDVERYLAWTAGLGVRQVVFRELSRLEGSYLPNVFTDWIEANRVPIEPLLAAVVPTLEAPRPGWAYAGSTFGYYYYNEHYQYQGLEVIFETSSYPALQAANATGVLQKLILHSDGTLSGDWDPDSQVLSRAEVVTA
jgi:hypothetical protein